MAAEGAGMAHFETQESTDHEVVFGSGAVSAGSSHDASTQSQLSSSARMHAAKKGKKRKRAAAASAKAAASLAAPAGITSQ